MAKKESNEIKITRLYDAPVKLVWDAWTDPKKAAKWWGPRGFTITTHSKDLRAGGHWSYTMHGPDGTDWPNKTIYHEVEKYKRLVYDHGGSDTAPPLFRVTVNFSEQNNKTLMDMTMTLSSPEKAREILKHIKQAGGNSTWDRLAEYLGGEEGKKQFVINRTFDAPIATMFNVWTDPKHLSQWLPPTGLTMEYVRPDIKTGSSTLFKMLSHQEIVMYVKSTYLEITPLHRIVYTQEFVDKDEKMSRHPGAPNFPGALKTTVVLAEEGPEQTRVTVTMEPFGEATLDEVAAFMNERPGMTLGWTGSFDQLDEVLTKM